MTTQHVSAELVAVISAVVEDTPLVLTAQDRARLPSGALRSDHRSMQAGLRAWVEQQTGHHLGYVEQLYTFADQDRAHDSDRVISVSYLGLTRLETRGAGWRDWYSFFPWEDRRSGGSPVDVLIRDRLREWVATGAAEERDGRELRAGVCFGLAGRPWLPELVLQRYELLFEVGLVPESLHASARPGRELLGEPMEADHRRILATGVARLRAKIQYHPVVFELVPDTFTLGQLQSAVEALAGQPLHKQNFRRLVMQQQLVEPTDAVDTGTGGRPARLYRFRRAVLDERQVAGTKLPRPR